VAVCDPNKSGADYPQWDTHEFCNSVRKLLGVDTGWDWLSPDQPIQLTHSLRVTGGVAGREPCQKIVDAYYATLQRSGQYHGCSANGFGTARSARCAKSPTGRTVLSGRKVSNAPRKPKPCPRVWIGISGSALLRNVLSTTPICLLSGADGAISVAALSATWGATLTTQFSAS